MEGDEEFDLTLSLVSSNAGVNVGSLSRATATITDATGKTLVILLYILQLHFSPGWFCQ